MNTTLANGVCHNQGGSFDHDLITIRPSSYLCGDGFFGRALAFLLLIPCLPLIGLLVFLTRMGSPGPGLYRQIRVGKYGKIFVMYKIRSMVVDAEQGTGPVWTQGGKEDPRITRVGAFLRRSHLDELPQLYNVLRGEMSLFGPRPERPELVHLLADNVPDYLNRLAVRPGITGLAQINLPPDSDLESVRRKLQLDFEYIKTASFWLDFRMFLWTALRLMAVPAVFATELLGLARDVEPVIAKSTQPVSIGQLLADSREFRQQAVAPRGRHAQVSSDR